MLKGVKITKNKIAYCGARFGIQLTSTQCNDVILFRKAVHSSTPDAAIVVGERISNRATMQSTHHSVYRNTKRIAMHKSPSRVG
jgi:hypothetical protein